MKFSLDDEVVEAFKFSITDNGTTIDPENEQDWYSLALGWALGRGYGIHDSHTFAIFASDNGLI